MRRSFKALGIPSMLLGSLLAVAGSSTAIAGLASVPASAQGTLTTCLKIDLRAENTGAGSGKVSSCDNQTVTDGAGSITSMNGFASSTIVWNSGDTSELTGALTFIPDGNCSASVPKTVKEFVTLSGFRGTVTGGNTFVGDSFSANLCAIRTGNAQKMTIDPGSSFLIG